MEHIIKRVKSLTYKNRKYLTIKKYGHIEMCNTENIIFIKAKGHYCELQMLDETTKLHDENIKRLLSLLPKQFERVHKSYVAPTNKVKSLRKHEGSRYELEPPNGVMISVGRTRYTNLKHKLDGL